MSQQTILTFTLAVALFLLASFVDLSSQSCSREFKEAFLDKHNEFRERHNVSFLVLDEDLSRNWAQKRANEIAANANFRDRTYYGTFNNRRWGTDRDYRDYRGRRGGYRGVYSDRDRGRGENVYLQWTNTDASPAGEVPVEAWYNEISRYRYFDEEPADLSRNNRWTDFTQVVWGDSKRLGVGCASRGNRYIVVGIYDPPGNIYGEFRENVFEPRNYYYSRNDNEDLAPILRRILANLG